MAAVGVEIHRHMIAKHVSSSLIFLTLTILLSPLVSAQPTTGDILLYYDHQRESPGTTAFNPSTGEKIELPVASGVDSIETSGDGRIAYTQDNDVWVLDVLNAPHSPVNITQTPDEQEAWLDWTPNGDLLQFQVGSAPGILYTYDGNRVLAVDIGYNLERHWNSHGWYVASQGGNTERLSWINWYVWNGKERVDLILPTLPIKPVWHKFLWTPHNHLFITVGYSEQEYIQPVGSTDIFYWNGNGSAVQAVDRPSNDETFILGDWSADGRLTLYTSKNHFDRWYVWDGVSFIADGVPDTSTFTSINSPTERIRDITWMPDGRLAIVAEGDPESDSLLGHSFSCIDRCVPQVYLWDSQGLQQVTSNDFGGFLVEVHKSGRIAVSNFDGLYIRGVTVYDTNLEPVFQSDEMPYTLSRWSADGYLAYCKLNNLLVWNGKDSILVSDTTTAKWLIAPSYSMTCFTG